MTREIHYQCQRCTSCCRWPGDVKVGTAEIAALAKFLRMDEYDFIQRYTCSGISATACPWLRSRTANAFSSMGAIAPCNP